MGIHYLHILLTVSLFGLFAVPASAVQQQTVMQGAYGLVADSLVTGTNGDIVGITVALESSASDTVKGSLRIVVPMGVQVLGNRMRELELAAAGKRYVPIKLQLGADAVAGEYPVIIQWTDVSGQVLAHMQTTLRIQPKRSVWLQALTANELMRQVGDSLSIRVLIRNAGNTQERVRLVISMPNQQGGRRFAAKDLELGAAGDTTLVFGYVIDRDLIRLERFTVNVVGMYSNDEIFGNTTISVQNASANRRYEDPLHTSVPVWSYQRNYATFIARNPFSDYPSWQLNGQGSYQLAQGHLDFSAFAYQWGAWRNTPILNNTWLNVEQDNKGITVGNITENLETFVNGRGVKVYFSDSLKSEHIEAGFVDRTFDLLGSDYRPAFGNGFTAYLRTRLGEGIPERKRYVGTAIYERLPFENSESILYMNSFDVLRQGLQNKVRLVADFGPALTRPLYDAKDGDYQPAMAAGVQLQANLAQWMINSTNYYSTGYYPGIRRGALQLNQRVTHPVRRANTWVGYSLYQYAPKYFENQPFYQNDFLTSRTELGISFPLTDFLSLSVVPLYEYEEGRYYFGNGNQTQPDMSLRTYRLNSTLNWRSRNHQQYAYLQMEGGRMQSSLTAGGEWQLRANLSYNYAWFNFNANLQRGNFSLIEAANNWYFGRAGAYRTGASASARREFMAKRLQTEAGISYYSDSFSGQNWMGNARVQYAVTPKTAFFFLGQLYRYHTPYYAGFSNTNIQLGIHQTLPAGRGTLVEKRGSIELFVYRDVNNNGIFDEGDIAAVNTMVMINQAVFITDNDGKATYRRVPYGSQQISVPVQQGWYAPSATVELGSKWLRATVGLQQAGSVRGSIRYQFDSRLSFEVDAVLAGFTVVAKSTTGYTARAVTDNQGNYVLFLPTGSYEVSIVENRMPQHVYVETPIQHIAVEANAINTGPTFVLKVEEKQVEVKRFSSP